MSDTQVVNLTSFEAAIALDALDEANISLELEPELWRLHHKEREPYVIHPDVSISMRLDTIKMSMDLDEGEPVISNEFPALLAAVRSYIDDPELPLFDGQSREEKLIKKLEAM
jgi:hypothetical protein